MMKKRKLGIIGGSGLYKMEGFEKSSGKSYNAVGKTIR
jgi:purine nucleoside phosphorylase